MIEIHDAVRIAVESVAPIEAETVAVLSAAGRILAEDLVAREAVPFDDVSAMDGWAVRSEDGAGARRISPPVVYAGEDPGPPLKANQVRRIMTGARLPEGADAVVKQEDAGLSEDGTEVIVPEVAPGTNVRRAGEAVANGSTVLPAGARLLPGALMLAVASGNAEVAVRARPRVFVATSGDELVEAGKPMRPGGVREGTRAPILAAVCEAGGEGIDGGIVPDDAGEIETRLAAALGEADMLVTVGGASVGAKDHMEEVLSALGAQIKFHGVRVKPGKPVGFALLEGKPVFFLPGNPVSALVGFEVFVRPTLLALLGARAKWRPSLSLPLAEAVSHRPGRGEFLRARVRWGRAPAVEVLPGQGSHEVRAMGEADALVFFEAERVSAERGELVPVLLLSGEGEAVPFYAE